jgi:hypothetical protein
MKKEKKGKKNEKWKTKKEKRKKKKKKRQMGTTQATHLSAEVVRSIISFDRPASLPWKISTIKDFIDSVFDWLALNPCRVDVGFRQERQWKNSSKGLR